MLRPAGRFVVIYSCFVPLARQLVNLALRAAPDDGDCRFYSTTQAARMLATAGFKMRTRRRGWGAYLLGAVKPC